MFARCPLCHKRVNLGEHAGTPLARLICPHCKRPMEEPEGKRHEARGQRQECSRDPTGSAIAAAERRRLLTPVRMYP